jgi:hypothetical protein
MSNKTKIAPPFLCRCEHVKMLAESRPLRNENWQIIESECGPDPPSKIFFFFLRGQL